jgi:hypothetical protein
MYIRTFICALAAAIGLFAQVSTDNAYQVRYASNLSIGDSVVNITNTGARGGVGFGSAPARVPAARSVQTCTRSRPMSR